MRLLLSAFPPDRVDTQRSRSASGEEQPDETEQDGQLAAVQNRAAPARRVRHEVGRVHMLATPRCDANWLPGRSGHRKGEKLLRAVGNENGGCSKLKPTLILLRSILLATVAAIGAVGPSAEPARTLSMNAISEQYVKLV